MKVLTTITALGEYLGSILGGSGVCEVLEQEMRLELRDRTGEDATIKKRQKVRLLQNNIIAFQDQAWGLGDIFAEYKCSPGIPVDRYLEGYRYRILISLRQTKNRGDIEDFRMERRIRKGFTLKDGSFQTVTEYKTHRLSMSIVFPATRKPSGAFLVEQQTGRTTPLGAEFMHPQPNGTLIIEWKTNRPRQFENYVIRWKW